MLQKVVGTRLYEQVVEQIKNMVARGIYKKGDMLPSEKELMDSTGVSRITVREALKTLAEVGIIETRHGKGSFVIVDPDELEGKAEDDAVILRSRQTFKWCCQARMAVEPEVARQIAAVASDEQISALENCLLNHTRGRDGGTETAFNSFHRALFEIADNPLLLEFFDHIRNLEDEAQLPMPLIRPELQKDVSQELDRQHRKILEAIRDHDGEFAYFYIKEHNAYLIKVYTEYFKWFF